MSFLKSSNDQITYPYNPQSDYPLTSFPIGASYPAFNCYWVFPTAPNNPDPALYDPVESDPVFNVDRWEQSWTFVEKPPAPPVPDWDSFNAYMLSDAMFKSYRDTVRPLDGELNSALFDAYGLVASNGVAAFSLVWGQWVSVSGITVEDREIIAGVAEGFSLPTEFVAIIRG